MGDLAFEQFTIIARKVTAGSSSRLLIQIKHRLP